MGLERNARQHSNGRGGCRLLVNDAMLCGSHDGRGSRTLALGVSFRRASPCFAVAVVEKPVNYLDFNLTLRAWSDLRAGINPLPTPVRDQTSNGNRMIQLRRS